ncbi:type II secretion system protein [Chloroflexota bacterium]
MRLPKIKLPKRGQKGFTLIELLIVVAILGVLAAVIIPNVSRFLGRGEEEAKITEKTTVQQAVLTLMIDNKLGAALAAPVDGTALDLPQNDMSAFPDNSTIITEKVADPDGTLYQAGDQGGYYLFDHDIVADNDAATLIKYVDRVTTVYYYTCDADGTIHQYEFGTVVPNAANPEV